MNFPQRLKQLRKEKYLTQRKLANMLGYGYTAIANYESGRNEPCIRDITKLANILEVSIDYLLGNSDVQYQKPSLWQQRLCKKLEENKIYLTSADQFFIEFLHYIISQNNKIMKKDFDEIFQNAIEESCQPFMDSIFKLMKNELYYDIVKKSILQEIYIK